MAVFDESGQEHALQAGSCRDIGNTSDTLWAAARRDEEE